MSCGCKIGGQKCGPCRQNQAQSEIIKDLRKQVSWLEACVNCLAEELEVRTKELNGWNYPPLKLPDKL